MPESEGTQSAPPVPAPMPSDAILTAPIAVEEGSPEAERWAAPGDETNDGALDTTVAVGDEPPTDGTSNDGDEGQAETPAPDADALNTVSDGDDEYDLSGFTEEQRKRFKALDREDRKAFYQLAEKHVESRIKANEAKTQELADAQAQRDAEAAEIRSTLGQFVGTEPIEIKDEDGEVIQTIPSAAEIERLLKTRNGEDILEDKYGLSRAEALDQLEIYEKNGKILDASADYFDRKSWAKLGVHLEDGLKAIEGIDPKAIVKGAQGPGDVVRRLNDAITAKYEAREAAIRKDYESRIDALDLNSQALKGKALAGGTRSPETGGRTGGSGAELTLDQYRAMTPEQQSKLSPEQIDRMTARLMARR